MLPLPSISTATPLGGATTKDTPAKIQKGATDFEALLLTEMLRSARQAGGGGLTGEAGDDGSDANSSLVELGEQQFAQALSASGGLGIAKMVVAGLTKHAD
jgi:Rod binding domain-containing protein